MRQKGGDGDGKSEVRGAGGVEVARVIIGGREGMIT